MSDYYKKPIKLKPSSLHEWDSYSSKEQIEVEFKQCIEEGLEMEQYADLFKAVADLPQDESKDKLSDALFDIVCYAERKPDFPYIEPSDYEEIQKLTKLYSYIEKDCSIPLRERIHGAWIGRICGCLLGKTVEGIRTEELIPFLKESGNYPMSRYILRSDINDSICDKYKFGFKYTVFANDCNGMVPDDDTNYIVMAQDVVERFGRDFKAENVLSQWVVSQPMTAYCTAERVAYRNFIKGYMPPESAVYKNPYREWIGAQIRGDYFGYINPGDPVTAAEMAYRDASISHVKNGIYGEMFVSAMIAGACLTDNIEDIIKIGLSQIPYTSRLYEAVETVIDMYNENVTCEEAFSFIHKKYDERNPHDWCHTISNAMIVTASLLYGKGDYGKSICMAVQTGFDTDCNGATVGSILGMMKGIKSIPEQWIAPVGDTLYTNISKREKVSISQCVDITLRHISK